jgi:hypothetical protein
MRISLNLSALKRTRWQDYAIRFFFGGAVTVGAGLVAKEFGPLAGGLFLAFPAIFPASATLVDKHERQKKLRSGIRHTTRGRKAAALDAFGAAQGSIGLATFGLVIWKLVPKLGGFPALVLATTVWLGISVSIWLAQKAIPHRLSSGLHR